LYFTGAVREPPLYCAHPTCQPETLVAEATNCRQHYFNEQHTGFFQAHVNISSQFMQDDSGQRGICCNGLQSGPGKKKKSDPPRPGLGIPPDGEWSPGSGHPAAIQPDAVFRLGWGLTSIVKGKDQTGRKA
jgi:hypothetical protein